MRLKALVPMLIGILLLSSPPAWAVEDCDSVIIDDAHLFGSGLSQVEAAANELTKLGATVRVRTIESFGNAGSIDNYESSLEKRCSSWQSADGGPRNNLVAILVSTGEREVGVNYGDQWVPAFRGDADAKIRTEVMTPRMRDGDFAGAFTAGLKEAARLIDAQLHPPKAANNGPTTVINQAPQDNSGFVVIFGWLLAIAVAGLGLFFGIRFYYNWKRENAERRAAQRDAQTAKAQVANLINNFDTTVLDARINKVIPLVTGEEKDILSRELASIEKDHAAFSAKFSSLEEVAGMNPDAPGLTALEYQNIGERYAALLMGGSALDERLKALDLAARNIELAAQVSPQLVTEAGKEIESSKNGIAAIAKTGFKTTDANNLLAEATNLYAQATEHQSGGRLGSAGAVAKEATAKAKEALAVAGVLKETKAKIDARLGLIGKRIEGAHQRAVDTKPIFDKIEDEYAEVLWKSVAGNGTEAQKRIESAETALTEASKGASMSHQEWNDATTHAVQAEKLLDEAEALLNSIVALEENLAAAKAKAGKEIEVAALDIDQADDYLNKWRGDINDEKLVADLKEAVSQLEAAEAELKQDKPNYLKVVKTALAANRAADDILAEAQEEHEAMERLRRNVASTMAEAKRSIDEAERYIGNHSSDVESGAKSSLSEAKRFYDQAQRTDGLKSRLKLFQDSDSSADQALAKAKDDVEEEEERIRRRKQQEARDTAIVVTSINSSHRSDNWGSPSPTSRHNGGSSGFGSSSSHGGSSGFGASAHHGGGSSW